MPPTPKPPGQRRRRNTGQPQWRELPAQGRSDAPPPLSGDEEWLESTVEWWGTIWASPMATMWLEGDIDSLRRLARLVDDFNRGERGGLTAIQNLEDRYGLSPKARRTLQWEIAKGEVVELPKREKRRLRAVEG